MKRFSFFGALLIVAAIGPSCSRKPAQAPANAPEVLVTTVMPRDVPRVLERVATLDGFINANINAQVQGYIISRDYKEGSVVKKGDLLFQIDPRPFEAALAQAKATRGKRPGQSGKGSRGRESARSICLTRKSSATRSEIPRSPPRGPTGQMWRLMRPQWNKPTRILATQKSRHRSMALLPFATASGRRSRRSEHGSADDRFTT